MRINQAYSPELQKDLRDIKQRLENLDRGSIGVPTARAITGRSKQRPMGADSRPLQTQVTGITELQSGVVNGDVYINGTLVVNGSEPLYTESDLLDPTFADVTGSRAVGGIYQNTETTMKVVQISVKLSA